jgi:NADH dehydrogenase
MTSILVVGATGQLVTDVIRDAIAAGHRVRALVRPGSRHAHLHGDGIELAFGDLRDAASLASACDGIDAVIATATVVFPRGRYSFDRDEGEGYRNLVDAATAAAVPRLLFVSIAMPYTRDYLATVPTLRMKAACEEMLEASSLDYTVVRSTPFMDDYFALMGSRIPLLGEPAATLSRARGATAALRALFGQTIERWGVAVVPGPADRRHAFVAVRDVAECLVSSIGDARASRRVLYVTGPEQLSWRDVATLYSRILGRRVRILSLPPRALALCAALARPFSEAVANQLSLLRVLGEQQTRVERPSGTQPAAKRTHAADYLAGKARMRAGASA